MEKWDHKDETLKDHIHLRYWVFEIDTYYPVGGMNDFRYSVDFLEDLVPTNADHMMILDTEKGRVLKSDEFHRPKWESSEC